MPLVWLERHKTVCMHKRVWNIFFCLLL